jgi:SpoVK/Ycf46/Vps4 family AAA+-type ATPase
MEKSMKKNLLKSMGRVYEKAKDCKLKSSFLNSIEKDLAMLSDYFGVSEKQSFFVAIVFSLNYKGDTVDLNDLIDYFDCNPTKILEYSEDFEALYNKGIFKKKRSKHRLNIALTNDQFVINEKISEAILKDQPMPVIEKRKESNDVIEVLEDFYTLWEEKREGVMHANELMIKGKSLITANQHFPLIKKIHDMKLDIVDAYVYIYQLWRALSGNEYTSVNKLVDVVFDDPSRKVKYMQEIFSNKNALVKESLIEIEEANFLNDTEMKLSDHSVKMLQKCGLKIYTNKKKNNDIIAPAGIHHKELYFNEAESRHIDVLRNLFQEDNLQKTRKRMKKKKLPQGITVLLHGYPGTGKTELVYQLAKETNREINKVDISGSKSMWFGESEKIVKRIFTDYKEYAKECDLMPILLFNEADAIIAKRRDITHSNIGQIENTIQNIILEELEQFEGIFFATTNLVKNLDVAFERRFLFKIKCNKPDITAKSKIWKAKLPYLKKKECEMLANRFDFSGGQIDNIVRKHAINEIISGTEVDINHILTYCETESMLDDGKKSIGFK